MKALHFAPVQGHTDAAYRHFHSLVYGGNQIYYTPFIRWEKDGLRTKDIKDIISPLNSSLHLIPQIIFRDAIELRALINALKEFNFKEIDLNMGCPFPLQTGHGRGAAAITNLQLANELVKTIEDNPDITFSLKMRLGLKDPTEWKSLIPYLNEVKFAHVTLHPRVAKRQYSGEINISQFTDFYHSSKNPVIFNGDIHSVEDVNNLIEQFPELQGIMVARGILGRPSLFAEIYFCEKWDKETRISKMLDFHNKLFQHYSSVLCGDAQIISKIKPFWEYSEEEIGRKAWKAIKKATNLSKYQTAVASI